MNCMKCGLEITEESVFCQNCLAEMEKYPVEPGTVVLLPRRKESLSAKKTVKRHTPSLEEQIATLRKAVKFMAILLVLCFIAIALMFKPTMHYVLDEYVPIGQNYSTVTPAQTPTE